MKYLKILSVLLVLLNIHFASAQCPAGGFTLSDGETLTTAILNTNSVVCIGNGVVADTIDAGTVTIGDNDHLVVLEFATLNLTDNFRAGSNDADLTVQSGGTISGTGKMDKWEGTSTIILETDALIYLDGNKVEREE